MKFCRFAIPVLCLVLTGLAAPASAQLSRVGSSQGLVTAAAMQGNDVAYDPAHGIYLVVGASSGTTDGVFCVFTDTGGNALNFFNIGAANTGTYRHYPRAEYSQDINGGNGGFLVTWHQNDGANNNVHSVVVAYPYGQITGEQILSDSPTYWLAGPSIAYSSATQRFLVVWQGGDFSIKGRFVDPSGAPTGGFGVMLYENAGCARDPGVAWNPAVNEFGLSYADFCGGAFAAFRHINANTGAPSGRSSFGFSKGTYNTDIDVNPYNNHYVMGWAEAAGSNFAEFDQNGNQVGGGLISSGVGGSTSFSIAFNTASATFLAVGQDPTGGEVVGAELNAGGSPISGKTTLTNGGGSKGSFYPRVTGRAGIAHWGVSYARQLNTLTEQIIASSSNGASPPAPTPTPTPTPAPTPPSTGCSGADPFASIGGGTCVNGGWTPGGSGGGSTTTGGCAGADPFAAIGGGHCVSGGWVPGAASSGGGGSTGGCAGADPFASMGGGTCVGGGWVPGGSGGGSSGGSSGGCGSADPFASIGGGTCVGGGWVPGGSGGGGSTGGCVGADPFAAIGGGHCVNGGWVPGAASGSGASTGGCAGADPFASIGGGHCVNGGWVPGAVSGGGASTGGCAGADPFASIGGGTCVGGGWIPAAPAASSCPTPNPFINIPGMTGVCINGGWIPQVGGRP